MLKVRMLEPVIIDSFLVDSLRRPVPIPNHFRPLQQSRQPGMGLNRINLQTVPAPGLRGQSWHPKLFSYYKGCRQVTMNGFKPCAE